MKARITRRRFVGGMVGAGVLTASRSALPGAAGANERIRAAVIGCRSRGHQNAQTFFDTGRFEIATLCDCDRAMYEVAAKALKGLPRAPAYERDFRRVLDDRGIDAVVIATPDHWHAIMTVLALQAGKHVFLEKPATHNVAEGRVLVDASKKHPKLALCIGTQQRSGRHFAEARQFIAEGGLGKVGFARAWIVHDRGVMPIVPDSAPPASMDYELWLGPAPYRGYNESRVHYNWHWVRATGTGEIGNWGAHWLDVARWLLDLGWPTSVSGLGGTVVNDAKEWPDTMTVLYEFGGLALLWELRLWTRYGVQGQGGAVEIGGDKGSLVINRGGWTFYPKEGEPVRHGGSDLVGPHAVNFAECIAGRAEPAASIEEGHRSATVCHLGNIAVTCNRRLAFDPAKETIVGDAEAAGLMSRSYREPWTLPAV